MAERVEDRLVALSEDQDGYFALRDAVAAGLPAPLILQLRSRGRVERISRGVYRVSNYPSSRFADLWAAVLWPRGNAAVRGVLSGETALLLHGGTDVNPAAIHVTVPKRSRIERSPTAPVILHFEDLGEDEVELIEGLPVTTAQRTLRDLRADPAQQRWANAFERYLEDRAADS